MEFGFLVTVALGLLSWGLLRFSNIIDEMRAKMSWIVTSLFSPELHRTHFIIDELYTVIELN